MAALTVVVAAQTPPAVVKRCECPACKHVGERMFRELRTKSWAHLGPQECEAMIVKSWHEYAPHLRRVEKTLPRRAVAVSYSATDTHALRTLQSWYDRTDGFEDDETNIAVLSGPPGTGKTTAAIQLVLYELAADATPVFMTGPQFARAPRYGKERDDLLKAEALILDDLGAERTTEHFVADVDELVDAFYQRHNTTLIITTNCTAPQFRKRYGMRVVDRLAEAGTWISCPGPSLRKRPEP